MLLILGELVFNTLFYTVSIYPALLLMEKIGKKRTGTAGERIFLALIMAAGTAIMQLVIHALLLIYNRGFRGM
ncbi:Hypothetical protein LUCI_5051 [Lucifera butyrica]|uniref:Uncharacterized protein n=1 Tax=Lucifera butyrica TaxID=1351585 RepID=A0A498RI11_9FIRM|nr:hypothetical protein [Lucifera butyrica]VBB09753.1 Hypothetical protein LUCI_5051 [Lucifera butyrica]